MAGKKIQWGILSTGWIAHKFAAALQVSGKSKLYAVGSVILVQRKNLQVNFTFPNPMAVMKSW